MPIINKHYIECDFCGHVSKVADTPQKALAAAGEERFIWASVPVQVQGDIDFDVKWACGNNKCIHQLIDWEEREGSAIRNGTRKS